MKEDLAKTNRVDASAQPAEAIDLNSTRPAGPDPTRHAGVLRSLRGLPSRRDVLRGLATTGLGLGAAVLPQLAEAKPKRRKNRKRLKPAKPNQYGCLEVKDACRRHSQCCSGICTGKPGKKRCRAHGTGTCNRAKPALCETTGVEQTFCNNSKQCTCTRTTAGSSFCGSLLDPSFCATCKRDLDCVKLGLPPGSACVPYATGICAGNCPTSTACMAPCGYVPPAPPEP